MKKLTAILGVLLFISLLSGASPAACSQWVWVHGCAGNYQKWIYNNPDINIGPDATGLYITFLENFQIASTPTIYYAIPAINGGAVAANRVCIKFRGYGTAHISGITVTNGEEIILYNDQLILGGLGYFEQSFDLGRTVVFDKGLCVAIDLTRGGVMSGDSLKIIAVGAYFNFNLQAGSNSSAINSLLLGD
jgi:hypothetical protein